MKRPASTAMCALLLLAFCIGQRPATTRSASKATTPMLDIKDIHIRDPFILADPNARTYYLYANASNRTRGGKGWECYTSRDLEHWTPPKTVFTPPGGFWADRDFWAPEVHRHKGKYYLFGTLSAAGAKRGTQILVADSPLGPFRPHSDRAATPHDWMALDGTLFLEDGRPWMVFCHEWVQIRNGTMDAVRLSDDLSKPLGKPITLFAAADAKWARPFRKDGYVTDGPCLYRTKSGRLLMLWSSFCQTGYAVGIAHSASGKLAGPWRQDAKPLFDANGGHPMLFRTHAGKLMLSLHAPNGPAGRPRARFLPVEEEDDTLVLAK